LGFQTKLDTNGTNPGMLKELLDEDLVDFIAMDIKAPMHKYALLTGISAPLRAIEKSIALVLWSGVEHQFRTTHVPDLLTSGDLQSIADTLPDGAVHVVQRFRPEHAMNASLCSMAGSA